MRAPYLLQGSSISSSVSTDMISYDSKDQTYGVIIPQTPTGSLKVITVVCGVEEGIVSPYARVASSANQDTNDAA